MKAARHLMALPLLFTALLLTANATELNIHFNCAGQAHGKDASIPEPQPLYSDVKEFRAVIESAFHKVQTIVKMNVALSFQDDDRSPYCQTGASQSPDGLYGDTLYICPKLRYFVANESQAMFVIAHEFGHLYYHHNEMTEEKASEVARAWGDEHPYLASILWKAPDSFACPRIERQKADQELLADQFAADALLHADPPINPAQGAFERIRIWTYLEATGTRDGFGHVDRKVEAARIMDRLHEWAKALPSKPPEPLVPSP